jgi:hypothetical protein
VVEAVAEVMPDTPTAELVTDHDHLGIVDVEPDPIDTDGTSITVDGAVQVHSWIARVRLFISIRRRRPSS